MKSIKCNFRSFETTTNGQKLRLVKKMDFPTMYCQIPNASRNNKLLGLITVKIENNFVPVSNSRPKSNRWTSTSSPSTNKLDCGVKSINVLCIPVHLRANSS